MAQDTVYFNKAWFAVEKQHAEYFSTVKPVSKSEQFYLVRDFTINGVLLSEYHYKGLQPDIDWTKIYEQGFQEFAVENGASTDYYPSGAEKKKFEYIDGKQQGLVTIWRENGKKESEYFAVDNIANGTYSEYFENGGINFTVNFVNDTLQGTAIYYHPNGKISQVGKFKNGLKFGKWKYLSDKGVSLGEEVYKATFFIDGPNVKISFPEGLWYLSESFKENGRLNFLFYRVKPNENQDSEVLPSCLISLESVTDDVGLIDYSSYRRRRLSLDIKKVIASEQKMFSLPQSIGYLGTHTDEQQEHTAILFHSLQNRVGMELILDCSSVDFDVLQEEFTYILGALKK